MQVVMFLLKAKSVLCNYQFDTNTAIRKKREAIYIPDEIFMECTAGLNFFYQQHAMVFTTYFFIVFFIFKNDKYRFFNA